MLCVIVHNKGKYNIYSTISNSFFFDSSMDENELRAWYKAYYGYNSMFNFEQKLIRAKEKGLFFPINDSIEDLLSSNECGKNKKYMPINECIKIFL